MSTELMTPLAATPTPVRPPRAGTERTTPRPIAAVTRPGFEADCSRIRHTLEQAGFVVGHPTGPRKA